MPHEVPIVRRTASILLLAICFGLCGCTSADKKAASNPPPYPRANNLNTSRPAAANPSQIADRSPGSPTVNGVLAGQVLTEANRRVPSTMIQVVSTGEGNANSAAPIEVAADTQGYFYIHGLQPGKTYQLIARGKDGNRNLVGRVSARPPKPNLLIVLNEDAGADNSKSRASTQGNLNPAASLGGIGGGPALETPGSNKGVDIGPPVRSTGPAEKEPTFNVTKPENIAKDSVARTDPIINLPGTGATAEPDRRVHRDALNGGLVPSCQLSGKQLENMVLNDLDGQPWEFAKDKKGKLILVDFWGTWCGHCYPAIRHLIALNNAYQRYGLEVVGIAEEFIDTDGKDPRVRVAAASKRLGVNYRMLMGGGLTHSFDPQKTCPVKTQFGVNAFPTLVLLDDSGRIIWRSEGLDERHAAELQILIEKNLRIQR